LIFVSDEIRNYFGETVAMYFAFLGFYTYFLVPPAVLGIVSHFFSSLLNEDTAVALFCIFNLVWATVFLESWKRRTMELAYKWGTIKMEQFEEPRAAFYGLSMMKDPITGQIQPYYPHYRRLLKLYLVSVPIMLAALSVAFFMMLFYFWLDAIAADFTENSSLPSVVTTLIMLLPTVIYAVVIAILYSIYRLLAISLNNWGKANFIV
jgi:anoctamin-10